MYYGKKKNKVTQSKKPCLWYGFYPSQISMRMMNRVSFPRGATTTASPSEREDGPADYCGLPVRLAADIRSFLVADDGSFKHEAIETMLAYLLKLKREVTTKGSTPGNANDRGTVPLNFIGNAEVCHPSATVSQAGTGQNYANVPTHVLRALVASMDGRARSHGPPPPLGLLPHSAGLHHHAHRDALCQIAANHARGVIAPCLATVGEASVASDGKTCEAHYYEERPGTDEVFGEKRKGGVLTHRDESSNSKRMRFDWTDLERYRRAVGAIPPAGFIGNSSVDQDFSSSRTNNWTYDQWVNTASAVDRRDRVEAGKNITTLSADAAAEERANRMALLIKNRSYAGDPCNRAFSNILVSAAAVDSPSTMGAVNASCGIEDLEQRWLARNGANAKDVVATSKEGKADAESSLANNSVANGAAKTEFKANWGAPPRGWTGTKKRKPKKPPSQWGEDAFDPTKNRPLNRFNLFFILERERLLMQMNDQGDNPAEKSTGKSSELPPGIATGYEGLKMPEFPPRFKHLKLRELFVRNMHITSLSYATPLAHLQLDFRRVADDWFFPGKRKLVKRRHRKSHGVMGFKKMAQELAASWRVIDGEFSACP